MTPKIVLHHRSEKHTAIPSGKHRQKKLGLGRPTVNFIESVITAVTRLEYKRPALLQKLLSSVQHATIFGSAVLCKRNYKKKL